MPHSTQLTPNEQPFSADLERWLASKEPKTVGSLQTIVAEKSFAIIFMVLMAIPALPIPTGGLTHVFEVVVLILCLEMLFGRRSIWLPERLLQRKLDGGLLNKGLPKLINIIKRFERFSRPRSAKLLDFWPVRSLIAIIIMIFTLTAFFSIPFSGLDTLPSMGIVLLSLGLILEDVVLAIAGVLLGSAGVGLAIGFGATATEIVRRIL